MFWLWMEAVAVLAVVTSFALSADWRPQRA